MKKSFFKKVMILCFALFGMVMIGNNVFATDPNDSEEPGDGNIGKGTLYGNEAGTLYCCCPGTNNCAAAACKGCP